MKRKNKTLLLLLVLILLLAGSAAAYFYRFGGQSVPSPSPSSSDGPSASPTPSREPVVKNNIILESPLSGDQVSFPFTIAGQGRVFENMVSLRVKDSTGQVLYTGNVYANAPDIGQFGPFQKEIGYFLKMPKSQNLTVEVFWNSPMDGSEMDVISVPVKLAAGETSTIKVFLGNNKLDPETVCDKVFAVDRIIPKTQTVAKKAIDVLLDGLSYAEMEGGYYTNLNSGIKVNSLNINGDTAKIDFDEMLQQGVGGSCKVTFIRAQITQTLKQFPAVKNVIISINGQTEDILQP